MSYQVRSGDTLSAIASRHGVSLSSLEQANPQIRNPNRIFSGEWINIPGQADSFQSPTQKHKPGTSGYTVQSGDTMSGIAARFGVSLGALEAANPQVRNPNLIQIGEHLSIPGGHFTPSPSPTPVGGPGPAVGGNVGQWISEAQKVLAAYGVPAWKMSASDINIIIQHESSGNPNAENKWDINWQEGHPSIGLMQTIGPTFNAYALPGHGNIWNPVDNIIAGVRYAISRYGSVSSVPGVVRVKEGLGYVGY